MIQEIDEGCDVFFEVYGIDAEKKASDLKKTFNERFWMFVNRVLIVYSLHFFLNN